MKKNVLVSTLGQIFNAEILGQMTEKDIVDMVVEEIKQVREANGALKQDIAGYQKAHSEDMLTIARLHGKTETTDLESGAPKLPGGALSPEFSQEVEHLIDCLGIRPENRLWNMLKCNDHSEDGRDDFAVWFDKVFYHQNRESCKAFLAKLKDVALTRKASKWVAYFQNDHLHLRRSG
jgi:hypothetical protein